MERKLSRGYNRKDFKCKDIGVRESSLGFIICILEMVQLRSTDGKTLPPKVTQQTAIRTKIRS